MFTSKLLVSRFYGYSTFFLKFYFAAFQNADSCDSSS